eukprot:m.84746 g.84746  ORF g.84746 m.84746 type:complete len:562 (+) comp14817_c0_seq4:835-2520(+)
MAFAAWPGPALVAMGMLVVVVVVIVARAWLMLPSKKKQGLAGHATDSFLSSCEASLRPSPTRRSAAARHRRRLQHGLLSAENTRESCTGGTATTGTGTANATKAVPELRLPPHSDTDSDDSIAAHVRLRHRGTSLSPPSRSATASPASSNASLVGGRRSPGGGSSRSSSRSSSPSKLKLRYRGWASSGLYIDQKGNLMVDDTERRFRLEQDDGSTLSADFDGVMMLQWISATTLQVTFTEQQALAPVSGSTPPGFDPCKFEFKYHSEASAKRVRDVLAEVFVSAESEDGRKSFTQLYKMGRLIGNGAFAKVYMCQSFTKPHLALAVKVIEVNNGMAGIGKPRNLADLLSEVRVMAKLHSDFIVRLHAHFIEADNLYLVIDRLGGDALSYLNRSHPLPEVAIRVMMTRLLRALDYLHDKGIIHRDVKLDNMFLNTNDPGSMKLGDLGISRRAGQDGTETGRAGTACFLAPEQITPGYGPEVDVWAAGCVLFTLLTKTYPFGVGGTASDTLDTLRRIAERDCDLDLISPPLQDLADSLLALPPEDRPTPQQALDQLDAVGPWQ